MESVHGAGKVRNRMDVVRDRQKSNKDVPKGKQMTEEPRGFVFRLRCSGIAPEEETCQWEFEGEESKQRVREKGEESARKRPGLKRSQCAHSVLSWGGGAAGQRSIGSGERQYSVRVSAVCIWNLDIDSIPKCLDLEIY